MKKLIAISILLIFSINNATSQETKEPKKWKFGLHFNTLTDKEKVFNGLTKGVIIHKVSKDHPAEVVGVLVGDILTHISGIEITDQPHCVEVMKNVDTTLGKSVLKIIRNGVKIDITVKFD